MQTLRVHLDFETYSECNIKTAGAHRYAQHPSTEVLLLGWAVGDEPVQLWVPHISPMPERLAQVLRDPAYQKWAFNATFERLILKYVLGIDVPLTDWRCTMVASYYLGFTGGLDAVLTQVGLQAKKDPRGQRLIQMFSSPNPKNYNDRRYDWDNRPTEFAEFGEYCVNDVVVERQLYHWLHKFPTMHDWDWDRYALDQRINDRGIYTDVDMAEGAERIWEKEKALLAEEFQELTGLERPTRGPFLEWLQQQGVDAQTTRKDELQQIATDTDTHPLVADAIRLWTEKEAKAVSKYAAVIRGAGRGQRARGMFQFKGASRTDRTAGRRLQLQNLKRPFAKSQKEIESLVRAIRTGNRDVIRLISDRPVAEVLGGCIRHAIQAPKGKALVVYDLASIESVVLGWLSMCDTIMNTFRQGMDTYKVFAAKRYGIDYEDVTKEMRNFSKPPVLGCGYMLGWKGLISYAEGYGVSMCEDESRDAVNTFRTMYPEIPKFWDWIYQAVIYTVKSGLPVEGYRLKIERDEEFLRIWLPSGRALSYHKPEVKQRVPPWANVTLANDYTGDNPMAFLRRQFPSLSDAEMADRGWFVSDSWVENVSYMGQDDMTNQWTRTFAHAGLFTENIVQSIAMDILFDGMTRVDAQGGEIVLQVHDEVAVETDAENVQAAAKLVHDSLTTLPHWGPDLWLGADGYSGEFYTS